MILIPSQSLGLLAKIIEYQVLYVWRYFYVSDPVSLYHSIRFIHLNHRVFLDVGLVCGMSTQYI